jgi:site-specific recombinase XerC
MSSTRPVPGDRQLPRGHLLVLNRSFRRTLEAENKSPRTIEAYTDAVRLLASYCQAHGHPLLAGELQRVHVQYFIADQLGRWKPATAHNRYRGLHAFFKWAVAEGDLEASPMDGMKPPQLPEQPIDAVRLDHLARLLKACEGRDFTSRRDTAVILLLVDTGMRRAECVGMTLDDIDLDQRIVWVLSKGHRPRALPIGRKTAQALDRYLRTREGAPAGPPAAALGRPQRVHDPVGGLSGRSRSGSGGWAAGHAPASAPACLRDQLAGQGRQRERADAGGWLEVTYPGRSLHQGHGGGARPGQPCPPVTGRPAIDPASTSSRARNAPRQPGADRLGPQAPPTSPAHPSAAAGTQPTRRVLGRRR